jgi:hypothetical protein
MEIIDYKTIKSITSKYPNLTSDNAEEVMLSKHTLIVTLQDEIYRLRELLRRAEDKIEVEKKEFNEMSKMFDIEYATITKKAIQNESSLMIKGHGNDLIGRTNTF